MSAEGSDLGVLEGDPSHWPLTDSEWGEWIRIYTCPQCGGAVVDPYQHKAWHLLFDRPA